MAQIERMANGIVASILGVVVAAGWPASGLRARRENGTPQRGCPQAD